MSWFKRCSYFIGCFIHFSMQSGQQAVFWLEIEVSLFQKSLTERLHYYLKNGDPISAKLWGIMLTIPGSSMSRWDRYWHGWHSGTSLTLTKHALVNRQWKLIPCRVCAGLKMHKHACRQAGQLRVFSQVTVHYKLLILLYIARKVLREMVALNCLFNNCTCRKVKRW